MKLICTITILFLLFSLNSQTQNYKVDSLRQIAGTQVGEEKLTTLGFVCLATVHTSGAIPASLELEKEARSQKSDINIARGYYYRLHHAVASRIETPYDSIVHYADEAIKFYTKSKSESGRAKIERMRIKYLLDNGNYELALYETESFLSSTANDIEVATAYELLGTIYMYLNQGKESVAMIQKGLRVCERNSNNPLFFELNVLLYNILFQSYSLMEDYSSSLSVVDTLIDKVIKHDGIFIEKQAFLFGINARKTSVYLGLKQYEKAEQLLKNMKAEKIQTTSQELSALLESAYGFYYLRTNDFNKALRSSNKALDFYTKDKNITNHIILLGQKAQILDSLHNYKLASKLKGDIINISDSITKTQASKQLAQIQTIFQVERLNSEKEQKKLKLQRAYIIGIALGIVCLLAILLFLFEKRNSKRLREKNKKLFEQYKYLPFKEIDNYVSQSVGDAMPEAINKQEIYNKVVEYLLSTQQYVDSELTRESLALEVGTNRQYLIEAIQENAQMTYSEFLTHLRLEHARKLLLQDSNFTIEKIYQLSGFNNKSTFYKHFGQKYGMTPTEFKAFVNEENVKRG